MIGRAISIHEIIEKEHRSGRSTLDDGAEEVKVATGDQLNPIYFKNGFVKPLSKWPSVTSSADLNSCCS